MCRKTSPFDFAKDLFPLLLAAHEPILGVPMDGYWCDIGTPRAYYQCSLDVLDGRLSRRDRTPRMICRHRSQTRTAAPSPAATART